MIFYVNAWLDRSEPFVSVCNRDTGTEVARFETAELEWLLQDGDLCMRDFCSAGPQQLQTLVKELLLLKCCYSFQSEVQEIQQNIKQRCPKVIPFARTAQCLSIEQVVPA